MRKLSTFQLVLLSTGGMIGSGWLFSPYYGLQTAGGGVILSWTITALLTLILGLTFAEVATCLPVVGGLMRFMGVTHSRTLGFMFLVLGWISYIVYLPLEAQSAIQYLGFWIPQLVSNHDGNVSLSSAGLWAALVVMVFLTWFNTLHLSKVSKTNAAVSLWKIFIPLLIAWGMILVFGKPEHFFASDHLPKLAFEPVLLAITSSGLAFAFSGFQNGLILANSTSNPKRAIPWSIFAPVIIGWILYSSLSLMFMFCLPSEKFALVKAVAPLLGLLSLFGLNYIYIILFVDAVIAPLGTANVFTAVTGRILLGLGREFFPRSILTRLNKSNAPAICLWINMLLGICFLLPFPTWTELVNFLSSLVLLSCMSGPVALIILRRKFPTLERKFTVPLYRLTGYLAFVSCGLFVYWSGTQNLLYLVILIIGVAIVYAVIFAKGNFIKVISESWFLIAYIAILYLISELHGKSIISFPADNYLVILFSLFFCWIFVNKHDQVESIAAKIEQFKHEVANEQH